MQTQNAQLTSDVYAKLCKSYFQGRTESDVLESDELRKNIESLDTGKLHELIGIVYALDTLLICGDAQGAETLRGAVYDFLCHNVGQTAWDEIRNRHASFRRKVNAHFRKRKAVKMGMIGD